MNCPKCGKKIKDNTCECGFRANRDMIALVGSKESVNNQISKLNQDLYERRRNTDEGNSTYRSEQIIQPGNENILSPVINPNSPHISDEKPDNRDFTGTRFDKRDLLASMMIGLLVVVLIIGAGGFSNFSNIVIDELFNFYNMVTNGSEHTDSTASDKIEYLSKTISELDSGMDQGLFKQVVFGTEEVYCLTNDGKVEVYAPDEEIGKKLNDEYSSWSEITNINVVSYYSYSGGYMQCNQTLIGIKDDGTVLAGIGTRLYQGEVDVSDWKDIIQIDASNGEMVLGLCADGTIVYSPSKNNSGENDWYRDSQTRLNGCTKIDSVETIGAEVWGLSSAGTLVFPYETDPSTYYHGDWRKPCSKWAHLRDFSICAYSTDVFGLTLDGKVLYGGCCADWGEVIVDEDEITSWSDIIEISTGASHLVALKSDGTVLAAGRNTYGQCDVEDWSDIARVEAYGDTTVGYGTDGKVYFTGYNCLENAVTKLRESICEPVNNISVHFYCVDAAETDALNNEEADGFGPRFDISDINTDVVSEVSDEFISRIKKDPVMAAACFAYFDRVMGTRYTGKFYSSISDDWITEINKIALKFIDDRTFWQSETQAFLNFLDCAQVSVQKTDVNAIESLNIVLGKNDVIPVISEQGWSSGNDSFYFLTYTVNVKGTEIPLSFVTNLGFVPVIESVE